MASSSSASQQTNTFFGFVVPLLYNPQAFPQPLVASNLSKLCTEQDDVKAAIREELRSMLGHQTDQVSSPPCRASADTLASLSIRPGLTLTTFARSC